jgi:hypothetical protein
MAMGQILHLIDVKDVEETYLEPSYETMLPVEERPKKEGVENYAEQHPKGGIA